MPNTIRIHEFETRYKRDGTPVDWVHYSPLHSLQTTSTWARVKELQPPENGFDPDRDRQGLKYTHMKFMWDQIEPAYTAWRSGQEMPETGIPLEAWAGLNKAAVDVLKNAGIRTVEEVAALSDGAARSIKLPDMHGLRRSAQSYLDSRGDADAADRMTKLEETNAALQEQLEKAMALIQQQGGDEKAALQAECDARGIEYDKRWGADRLRAALEMEAA